MDDAVTVGTDVLIAVSFAGVVVADELPARGVGCVGGSSIHKPQPDNAVITTTLTSERLATVLSLAVDHRTFVLDSRPGSIYVAAGP